MYIQMQMTYSLLLGFFYQPVDYCRYSVVSQSYMYIVLLNSFII